MDAKHAVAVAKQYVADLFQDEGLRNLGLEEVDFDEKEGMWHVTIGFSRKWDEPANALAAIAGDTRTKRSYKVVRIRDGDGKVVSVKDFQGKA